VPPLVVKGPSLLLPGGDAYPPFSKIESIHFFMEGGFSRGSLRARCVDPGGFARRAYCLLLKRRQSVSLLEETLGVFNLQRGLSPPRSG